MRGKLNNLGKWFSIQLRCEIVYFYGKERCENYNIMYLRITATPCDVFFLLNTPCDDE